LASPVIKEYPVGNGWEKPSLIHTKPKIATRALTASACAIAAIAFNLCVHNAATRASSTEHNQPESAPASDTLPNLITQLTRASTPTRTFTARATTYEKLSDTPATNSSDPLAGIGPETRHAMFFIGPRGYVSDTTHPLQRPAARTISGELYVDGVLTDIEPDQAVAERVDLQGINIGTGWSLIGTQLPHFVSNLITQEQPTYRSEGLLVVVSFPTLDIEVTIDPKRLVVTKIYQGNFLPDRATTWHALEWKNVPGITAPYPTIIHWTVVDGTKKLIADTLTITELNPAPIPEKAFNWWTYTKYAKDESGTIFVAGNKIISSIPEEDPVAFPNKGAIIPGRDSFWFQSKVRPWHIVLGAGLLCIAIGVALRIRALYT